MEHSQMFLFALHHEHHHHHRSTCEHTRTHANEIEQFSMRVNPSN